MPENEFTRLIEIMAKLRSADGCPWDREQTPESLCPYIAEEACEVIEALVGEDTAAICEELGDLLLQIVFQARIFEERGAFTIVDVIKSINDKLERRHPHVFGDHPPITCPEEQSLLWETIKQNERSAKPPASPTTKSAPLTTAPLTTAPLTTAPLTPIVRLALNLLKDVQRPSPLPARDELLRQLLKVTTATQNSERDQAIDSLLLSLAALRTAPCDQS